MIPELYIDNHFSAEGMATMSNDDDGRPACPGPNCWLCNGEACNLCPSVTLDRKCAHATDERHAMLRPVELSVSGELQTLFCIRGSDGGPAFDIGLRKPSPSNQVETSWDDYKAWEAFVSQISLNGPMMCRFEAEYSAMHRETAIMMMMKTLHRDAASAPWWADARDGDTRKLFSNDPSVKGLALKTFTVSATHVMFGMTVPTRRPIPGVSLRWVRALAREGWLHELDEFLMVNGERPYDPHTVAEYDR